MIKLAEFFASGIGRIATVVALLAALVGLRMADVAHQRHVGEVREQVRVEAVGQKIDAKAQKKRERIERAPPAEVDAALRKYCRDCQ